MKNIRTFLVSLTLYNRIYVCIVVIVVIFLILVFYDFFFRLFFVETDTISHIFHADSITNNWDVTISETHLTQTFLNKFCKGYQECSYKVSRKRCREDSPTKWLSSVFPESKSSYHLLSDDDTIYVITLNYIIYEKSWQILNINYYRIVSKLLK